MASNLSTTVSVTTCIVCGEFIPPGVDHVCGLSWPQVSREELSKALDSLAWDIAQKVANELPPYLTDDDLTAERFYQRNKDRMSEKEAASILERLVEEGKLEKQERRRKGKSGTRPVVYVVKDS